MPATWPSDWAERYSGAACEMCGSSNDPYGLTIHTTPLVDAVLQRADVQRGYTVVIWRGRHVAEPYDLTDEESGEYWRSVGRVGRALAAFYRPLKMNYETLGNSVPHLHTHLLPRYAEDPAPGAPFPLAQRGTGTRDEATLRADAVALRALLAD